LDRGGAINTITPEGIVSRHCAGQATSGFLVEVEKVTLKQMAIIHRDFPGVETAEDVPSNNTNQAGGTTQVKGNSPDASFRGGRPVLNPGDMYWQGRDENFVVLRRGGVRGLSPKKAID
jgi:hypothetical protein